MKNTFIAGFVALVSGGILAAAGFSQGGAQSVYWDNGLKIDKQVNQTTAIDHVKQITVAGDDFGPVEIHRGDTAKVTIRANKSDHVHAKVVGHRITISCSEGGAVMLGDFGSHTEAVPVEITVPRKTQIQKISLSSGSDVHIDQLTVQEINSQGNGDFSMTNTTVTKKLTIGGKSDNDIAMDNVKIANGLKLNTAGDISIKNSDFTRTASQINSEDGDINLANNTWSGLAVVSGSGDITLMNDTLNGKSRASATAQNGDVDATITPQPDTSIIAKTSDGDVRIYGNAKRTYGQPVSGRATYQFSSESGDVTVRK